MFSMIGKKGGKTVGIGRGGKNLIKKRARIKAGSGEKMRTPGSKGAPTAKNFADSAKTAKKA
jgi:hypothetical protein